MNRSFLPHDKKNAGFSFIEIMLVMGLLGLLAALVLPEMVDFNERQALNSVTTKVVDNLHEVQGLAAGAVQSAGDFVAKYRFNLVHNPADPSNTYRTYQLERIDDTGTLITPILSTETNGCSVCVISTESEIDFNIPTGEIDGLSSDLTLQVCYPGQGLYNVIVERQGRIYHGDFQTSSCVCNLNGC